jgi:putative ABC transport system permease protein
MTHLALQNLWQQKFRLALTVTGVALAMGLIILLNGFEAGVYRQVTAYLDHTPADYVVAEESVRNLLGVQSLLPGNAEALARGVPGIVQVTPIYARFVILDLHAKKVPVYMVGYEPRSGGGPWRMQAGRLPTADTEVVLDWVLAQAHGFALGDTLEILGKNFNVVGLSDETNSWMAGFLFLRKGAVEKLVLTPNATSFLLLALAPEVDATAVEERLRRRLRNDVELLPAATVKQNDVTLMAKVFAVPLRLMVTVAFVVGTAILSMVIYSATVERMREYGVLKAVGAHNRHLYWLVTQQGVATAVLGVALGIGLAALAAQWIMRSTPKFLIVLEPRMVLITAASGLLLGVLAALLPARRAAGLDPVEVFRK